MDHTVVNGLIGVLEGLQVGVLKGQKGSRSLSGLISCSYVDEEAEVHGSRELLRLGKHSESVVQFSYVVFRLSVFDFDGFVTL